MDVEEYLKMESSCLYFISIMWGFVPQPIKPEYETRFRLGLLLKDKDWDNFTKTITPEWFLPYQQGLHLTWQQSLVCFGIDKALKGEVPFRTSIVSGHGIGKSALISILVLWFLFVHPNCRIGCTAPSQAGLYDVLWSEIKKWIQKMPLSVQEMYVWESTHIRMKEDPNEWFARAKTASKENTEALAGIHADWVMLIADEACHDDKTEILTERGWKLFKDLDNEKVMTMDNKGFGVLQNYTKYHEYNHDGLMIQSSLRRGADFMVTPNHDLYGKTSERGYRNRPYQKRKAEKINGQDFHIPRVIKWKGIETFSEDEMRLAGWVLSEGSFHKNKKTGEPYSVIISQSLINSENRKEIMELLDRMGYKYLSNKKDIWINDIKLVQKMIQFGIGFKEKHIPEEYKKQSPRLLSLMLDTFMLGDGYTRENREILYTSSPKLADDLQECILKTGYNSTVTIRKIKGQKKWINDHWATSSCDGYVVSRSYNGSHFKINHNKIKEVEYKGKTYCVTVPNGIIMTRRNGKVMWSGNSGVEEPVFETMEGSLTSGNILVFLISNGTRSTGYFYNTHHKDSLMWQNYSFSSLDSPRVDQKYVDGIVEKYGVDSVQYAIRVEGKFPDEGIMDDRGYVQMFNEKDLHFVPFDMDWKPMGRVAGALDASGEGQDRSVWAVKDRQRIGIVAEEASSTPASMALKSITVCDKYQIDPIDFIIDAFGSGMNVAQEIALATSQQKRPWRVQPINSGEQCDQDEDRELYLNKRAEAYYKLKIYLQQGGQIMEHPKLKDQLLSIRYRRTANGRIQIMDKTQSKKLGFPSPDYADAMSYTMLVRDGVKRSTWGDVSVNKGFDPHDPIGE